MDGRHIEHLDGGLVTWADGAVELLPGELQLADNGIYRPNIRSICPVRARGVFGTNFGQNITGLRALPFDGVTDFPVVVAQATKWTVVQATAGNTDIATGVVNNKRLEAVHYNNKYVVSNGQSLDTALVVSSDLSTITHGMVIPDTPSTSLVAGTMHAESGADGTKTFWYWITEYDSTNDIESPASARATAIPSTVQNVRITFPAAFNNANADSWRLYRGGPTTFTAPAATYDPFPEGYRVVEQASPGGTYDDDGTPSVTPFGWLQISVQGSPAVKIERDTAPPTWETGDIFEDQLVVNDTSDESLVRYSYPGLIHSFPSLYFINFETKKADKVNFIRTLGEVCVVGLQNQIWRLMYLPNETDSEFSRGRCRELISPDHGIMGNDSACLLALEDGSPMLAYVSHDGLHMTDGFRTTTLTDDLDWAALVDTFYLDKSILVNAQHLYCLLFYYTARGSTFPNDQVLALSYHPKHLKNGKLKVAGPWDLTTYSADYGNFTAFAGDADRIVTEDDGAVQEMTIQTRLIYPGDIGDETQVERVWLFTSTPAEAGTGDVVLTGGTLTRIEGFEGGGGFVDHTSPNYFDGQGGSAFSWVTGRNGGLAVQISPADTGSHYALLTGEYTSTGEQGSTDRDVLLASFFMKITAYPSGDERLAAMMDNAGSPQSYLEVTSAGLLKLNGGTAGPTTLALNTWYYVDWLYDLDGNTEVIRVNEATEISGTPSGTQVRQFQIGRGNAGANPGYTILYDDVILQLADAVASVGYISPYMIKRMDPDGDGTDDDWTGTTSPNEYQSVDEINPDSDTTLAISGTGADAQTFTLESTSDAGIPAGSTILGAQYAAYVRRTLSGASSPYELRIRSGSTTDDKDFATAPTSYSVRGRVDAVDPDTSAAWTISALDAVEVGIDHQASVGTTRCTSVNFQVAFI